MAQAYEKFISVMQVLLYVYCIYSDTDLKCLEIFLTSKEIIIYTYRLLHLGICKCVCTQLVNGGIIS